MKKLISFLTLGIFFLTGGFVAYQRVGQGEDIGQLLLLSLLGVFVLLQGVLQIRKKGDPGYFSLGVVVFFSFVVMTGG